ncbi:TRAP transporter large permease [Bosea sp. (in: a-proteobacteria)]|jgi:tripartite ATP-independent transporter DctM subunit|uniref:TRAP transporter large permease n=1 Tax=Bosea sp. (in: a-proteobacteria) TaxID=1871050 RepID=UPI001AC23973|nr:TRAP transporter large permease [Bosea sp. (in: a-proteobacteria)]MBN9435963.1 TRAP transporter large permease [Bosea sp. (in: a-proteobacteria)]MBN9446678.1 TRAP transporter large permease [Bosea sp. (in: a-proteobacteria)]MBN9469502.1 TRAP transporter large permease [Bosea sp. (in: a-proteobacteria)]
MSGFSLALTGFGVMLALMALRLPIGLAMLVVGSAGYVQLNGLEPFLNYIRTTPYQIFANYTLSVIPLFVLMGAFAERSGLAGDLFKAASGFIGHRRGGLGMAMIGACTGFGAICGSSVATTATFARAALPQLRGYRYDPGFACGVTAVGGTLGILIPPSVILVVYAISTEQNIAKLFQAALIPGLMATAFYCLTIGIMSRRDATLGPAHERIPWRERWPLLIGVIPALAVAVIVVGGIYGGIFTPTEGASVGAFIMLAIGLFRRTLGFEGIKQAILQTAETSAMIFAILLGAEVFNAFLALTQVPTAAAEMIAASGWQPYTVLIGLLLFYIVLGGVMDELAMILLTLPVFFPIVTALDFGMPVDDIAIWFGILVLIVVGIGMTCPPIGLNVFVVASLARDVPITRIYRGVLPFVASDIIRLGICVAFPALSLYLVKLLN